MPGPKLRFRALIEIRGINPYVLVSAEQAARLKRNWRKPMPVRIQVNGKPDIPWRVNLMPVGDGSFYLYLQGQVRKESGTSVGDIARLTVEFDDEYRGGPVDPVPSWFGDELLRNHSALKGWNGLPPSRQKEILRYLIGLKSPLAQQRNVQRALHVLAGGKARFMGRSWGSASLHLGR
jgi:Domain of unknown function (DUF1905)/Bacteriocin-protection, YdeI or OmpD-Associated